MAAFLNNLYWKREQENVVIQCVLKAGSALPFLERNPAPQVINILFKDFI